MADVGNIVDAVQEFLPLIVVEVTPFTSNDVEGLSTLVYMGRRVWSKRTLPSFQQLQALTRRRLQPRKPLRPGLLVSIRVHKPVTRRR